MGRMKRKREEEGGTSALMESIVWQTPANTPQPQDYIFRNGRRYVKPYYFEFMSHVKNRWEGKTIVDLFAHEFKGRPYEYYVNAVKSGRIKVNGQNVPVSYVIKSSQKISHFVHRHEPPVMHWDVSILQKEADVLTVCKPASVPVHPCGQYRKNTVAGILEAEHGLAPLFPIHRLDRLVSGLLIFARNALKAEVFRQQIEAGLVHKQYIAKVVGEFPENEKVVDANIDYNHREGRSTAEPSGSAKGKAACTKFTKMSSNGTHSIVLCEPITGRTHQIRVHLQWLGHPIANDYLYLSEQDVDRSSMGMNADRTSLYLNAPLSSDLGNRLLHEKEDCRHEDFSIDPLCTNCPNLAPVGYDGNEEGLWLHCVRYSGQEWTYECPYPNWAHLN